MKNKTNLSYRGDVTIKLTIGDKIIEYKNHNAGLPALMKSLCKFLVGQGNPAEIPEYLDLKRRLAGSGEPWDSYITQQVSCGTSGRIYEFDTDVNNWVARYTFSIPYAILVDYVEIDDTAHEYRLVLYAENPDGSQLELAYLPVSPAELSRITPGIQAIVEWSLQIKNDTSEED